MNGNDNCDILQVSNINSKGYGIIAKLAMTDKRLSIQAKGIYGYFCSFAGSGRQAFPRVSKIRSDLQMSKDSYYKHFKMLKDLGYICVEQKYENGRLSVNIYTLMDDIPDCTDATVPENKKLCPKKQDTVKQDTVKQRTVNKDAYISNSSYKKQSYKNISLSSQSVKTDGQDGKNKAYDSDNVKNKIAMLEKQINENISYDAFIHERYPEIKLVDEFKSVMLDTFMTNSKTLRVNGVDEPTELVRHNLLNLKHSHMLYVIDQLKKYSEPIRKKPEYMRTMLFNAAKEENFHHTNAYYSGET